MEFIIYQSNLRKYFTNKGKVIVFNDEKEAINFANAFYQTYALPIAMENAFSNPGLMEAVIQASNAWQVQELPKEYEFETISFEEIKKTRGGN